MTVMLDFCALSGTQWQQLIAIEQASHTHPWSAQQLQDSIKAGHWAKALIDMANEVIAYAVVMPNIDDWELLNITTSPAHRQQGLAQTLLVQALQHAQQQGAAGMVLEVRASNAAAIALYQRLGFTDIGLRKGYYRTAHVAAQEDARVMRRQLATAP